MKPIASLATLVAATIATSKAVPEANNFHLGIPLNWTLLAEPGTGKIPPHGVRKRELPGGVYVCDLDDFTGNCGWLAPNSACHIAGSGPHSIGPDPGGVCRIYMGSECLPAKQISVINFPGKKTGLANAGWSFKCSANKW